MSIYEGSHQLIYDSSFYQKKFIFIDGKSNSTYLIRFSNNNIAERRLVTMKVSKMIEEHHFKDKITVEDVADHPQRI